MFSEISCVFSLFWIFVFLLPCLFVLFLYLFCSFHLAHFVFSFFGGLPYAPSFVFLRCFFPDFVSILILRSLHPIRFSFLLFALFLLLLSAVLFPCVYVCFALFTMFSSFSFCPSLPFFCILYSSFVSSFSLFGFIPFVVSFQQQKNPCVLSSLFIVACLFVSSFVLPWVKSFLFFCKKNLHVSSFPLVASFLFVASFPIWVLTLIFHLECDPGCDMRYHI